MSKCEMNKQRDDDGDGDDDGDDEVKACKRTESLQILDGMIEIRKCNFSSAIDLFATTSLAYRDTPR
jgi:hypothetical protein